MAGDEGKRMLVEPAVAAASISAAVHMDERSLEGEVLPPPLKAPRPPSPSDKHYWWIRAGRSDPIVLTKDNSEQKVVWGTVPAHGSWNYKYDASTDVGTMTVIFNCKGDPSRMKIHELVQLPNTDCFAELKTEQPQEQIVMVLRKE